MCSVQSCGAVASVRSAWRRLRGAWKGAKDDREEIDTDEGNSSKVLGLFERKFPRGQRVSGHGMPSVSSEEWA
jgi:hypothetical protein